MSLFKRGIVFLVIFSLVFTFVNIENQFVNAQSQSLYVANSGSDTVSVIDPSTQTVIKTIPLAPGSSPWGIAATPNGRKVYVVNSGNGTVSVIDARSGSVYKTIFLSKDSWPSNIAITPDGTKAFVTDNNTNTIFVIDTATDSIVHSFIIPGSLSAWDIAISPDGTTVYVTDDGASGNVFAIDTSTYALLVPPIATGGTGAGITVTPNGSKVYTASPLGNGFSINTTTFAVAPIVWPIQPPVIGPWDVAVHPSGAFAYFTDSFFGGGGTTVLIVDTTVDTQTGVISVPPDPVKVVFSSNGAKAYVTHLSGSVSVIDTATHAVIGNISLGSQSQSMGMAFAQTPRVQRTINPVAAFKPVVVYRLSHLNTQLACIEAHLSEEVPQNIQDLLDEMQTHIDTANTTNNTIYANNELLKALELSEIIQEEMGITCS